MEEWNLPASIAKAATAAFLVSTEMKSSLFVSRIRLIVFASLLD